MKKCYLVLFFIVSLSACFNNKNIIHYDCYYTNVKLQDIAYTLSYFEKFKKNVIFSDTMDMKFHTEVTYHDFLYNSNKESEKLNVVSFNDDKMYFYQINGLFQLTKCKEVKDRNSLKLRSILADLPANKYEKRDCCIEDGSSGIFLVMKNDIVEYYFESEGVSCEMTENNRPNEIITFIKLTKNILKK
ncbi:MAG: hypothetical protein ACPG5B_10215 [Chitinophagales bacterium]